MGEEKAYSILHHLNILNHMVIVIPLVTAVLAYIVHYSISKNSVNYFPFMSEMTLFDPESRIVTAGLAATSLLIMMIVYVRAKIVFLSKKKISKIPERRYSITHRIMMISSYVAVICHLLTTIFTLRDFPIMHAICINLTYYSFVVYSFTGDMIFKIVGYSAHRLSRVMTMVLFTFTLTFLALRYYVPNDKGDALRITAANLFAVLAYISLYLKLFLVKFDLPTCGIRLSKKISL